MPQLKLIVASLRYSCWFTRTRLALIHTGVLFAVFLSLAASTGADAGERVAAFLDESSPALGRDASTALTILRAELGSKGLTVAEVPVLDEVYRATAYAKAAVAAAGVERLFVLKVMPLGRKIVVALDEHSGPSLEIVYSERMTASSVEELDVVIPRLVSAVLSRSPVADQASVQTVTGEEARAWRKKHGEFLWGAGIPLGVAFRSGGEFSYGASLRLAYEMEAARVDGSAVVQFSGGEEDLVYGNFAIEGYYLFSQRNISPYFGGGVGYAFTRIDEDRLDDVSDGIIMNVGGGVEFFRLYDKRLLFDVKVGLPTYKLRDQGKSHWVPVLTSTLSFLW